MGRVCKSQRHEQEFGAMNEKKDMGPKALGLMRFFANERSGATAIEYGIIAGSLSIAIAVSVDGIGSSLNTIFTTVKGLF